MPNIRVVHDQKLAIWGEATAGTRPNPVTKAAELPFISAEVGITEARAESEVISGARMPSKPIRGLYSFEGRNVVVPIQAGSVGVWLFKAFERYSVSGAAAPYTHAFKAGGGAGWDHSPYFGVELWDGANARGSVFDGVAVQSVALEVTGGTTREARLEIGLIGLGKGEFNTTARQDTTPLTFSGSFWNEQDATVKVDGTASQLVTRARLEMQRSVSVRKVFDGTRYASWLVLGGVQSVTVSITGLWDDTSQIQSLATGLGEHSVELVIPNPDAPTTHNISFLIPELQAYLTAVPAVASGGNELEVTIEGAGYYNDSTEQTPLQVTLIDDLATYVGLID